MNETRVPERISVRIHQNGIMSGRIAGQSFPLTSAVVIEADYVRADLARPAPDEALRERARIAEELEHEASTTPCEEDAKVVRDCAALVRANFSYEGAFDGTAFARLTPGEEGREDG